MSNFQNKFIRKMPSPFLKYTEVPGEKGTMQVGDNSSGTLSFNSNSLITESGTSQFVPPGASRNRLGDPECIGGVIKKVPELIGMIPPVPEFIPDKTGLVFVIPAVAVCAAILRENVK